MDIKDVCDAGVEILDAVADAVSRNDYRGLSKNVEKTVVRVMDQADQARMGRRYNAPNADKYKSLYKNGRMTNYQSSQTGSIMSEKYMSIHDQGNALGQKARNTADIILGRNLPATVTRTPAGRILGPIQLGWGILGTTGFGITAVALGLTFAAGGFQSTALGITAVVFAILTGITISDIVRGNGKINLVRRFRQYVDLIGNRGYIAIEELAVMTGRKKEAVLQDLKKMMKRRMFLQGRLDAQETTFMLTNDVYEQYRMAENERRHKEAKEQLERQEAQKQNETIQNNQAYDSETKKILTEGNAYIRMVRECNERISDAAMSDKLERLESIMKRIFAQVEKHPENAEDLHKFMTLYLPTTKKLLNAYIDLDQQGISGQNIVNTKKEIEGTLDTINAAFEKLLDGLFEDTAWDISSDISVMKTMMAQEGLTGNDFQVK